MSSPDQKTRDLIGHLAHQLFKGWAAFQVAKNVYRGRTSQRVNSVHWFFGIVEETSIETAILYLSKIIIPQRSSISIQYLLNYVEQNPQSFPKIQEEVLRNIIREDRDQLETINTLTANVKEQRDRTIAHLDKLHVNNPSGVYSHPPLDYNEVENAFRMLLAMLNHYSGLIMPSEDITIAGVSESISEDYDYLIGLIEEDNRRD